MQGDPVVEQATAAPGEHRNINKTHALAQALACVLLAACDHDVATALAAVEKAAAR